MMTIKKRFMYSYISAIMITIMSLFLIVSLAFYVALGKVPNITTIYKMITTQRSLTVDEKNSYLGLDNLIQENPDQLMSPLADNVAQLIKTIEEKNLYVVIRKGDDFSYFSKGLVEKSLKAHSPNYEINNFEPVGTLDNAGRMYHYIKSDFLYNDGKYGSIIILKRESNLLEFFTKWGVWLVIFIILVAVLLASLIIQRLKKTIIQPIEHLEEATFSVKESDNLSNMIEQFPDKNIVKEVERLQISFKNMWIELERAKKISEQYEDNRKELITNISHDLKTPITSIMGYVEGMLDGVANTDEKKQRYLQTIYKKSQSLNELIEELFLYSKFDMDAVLFHYDRVNLTNFIQELMEDYLVDEKVEWTVNLPEEAIYYDIDTIQFHRALTNIIQNSLKFLDSTKKTSKISLSLINTEQSVIIEVIDNGIGMTQEQVNKAFQRFYRGDKSRTPSTKGSGLGLSIVEYIIRQHGGDLAVTSEEKEWTNMQIILPKKKGEDINESYINH